MIKTTEIDKAIIEIDKQYGTSITTFKENGVLSKKHSTIENIQEVLLENFKFSTGFLPAGSRWYNRGDDMETVILESPPSIRRVSFSKRSNTEEYIIPVPWTLWSFSLKKSHGKAILSSSSVWAMKNPITPGKEKEHPLFTFPFSNVSGSICWGGSRETRNIIESINHISKIGRMVEVFWSAPFNTDLDGGKYHPFQNENDETIDHCHGLLQYLNGKDKFPYDILKLDETLGVQI